MLRSFMDLPGKSVHKNKKGKRKEFIFIIQWKLNLHSRVHLHLAVQDTNTHNIDHFFDMLHCAALFT